MYDVDWRPAVFGLAVLSLLVGSVAALWLTGQDLDLAAMIGFIAVTGVAVRNSLPVDRITEVRVLDPYFYL